MTSNTLSLTPREFQSGTRRRLVVVRRLGRDPAALVGLALISVVIACAVAAPVIAPYHPNAMEPIKRLNSPTLKHPAGTDQFGRDILTRILYGSRPTLAVGLMSVAIAAVLGVTLGLLAGYYGQRSDSVIMTCTDIMLAFPGILLALGIVAVLGPNLQNTMIAVGLSSVPIYTRLVRGSVLTVKRMAYIDAARVLGVPDRMIIVRHVLPNVMAPIIVVSTVGIAGAILTGASLGFIGLGAQPPSPEWGAMLSGGRDYLQLAWWVATFPGLAIMVVVLSINVVGDSLRDILDPRLRLRE